MTSPPTFRFYPNCYDDGAMERTEAVCTVCGLARGWAYTGSPYGRDPPKAPCAWCIADGRAASRNHSFFNEVDDAKPDLAEEVSLRTPHPLAWQDFLWPVSGGKPMIYEGRIDYESVRSDRKRLAALRAAAPDEETMRDWVSKDNDVNVMLFRSMTGDKFFGIMDAS